MQLSLVIVPVCLIGDCDHTCNATFINNSASKSHMSAHTSICDDIYIEYNFH